MGLFEAAGAVMATGWTAVSGVIAAGWAVIMGPVTPFVIAAGVLVAAVSGIAAAAAIATAKGMDFSDAWAIAKDTLGDLLDIAKRVGGVLADALSGGDFDIVFRAAMAGIKLTLAATLDALKSGWNLFWEGALEVAKTFFMHFGNIAVKMVGAVTKALSNPVSGAKALKSAIDSITNEKFDITFGIDTEKMRKDANDEIAKLEQELVDRKAKREAEAKNDAGGKNKGDISPEEQEQIDAARRAERQAWREEDALKQKLQDLKDGLNPQEEMWTEKDALNARLQKELRELKAGKSDSGYDFSSGGPAGIKKSAMASFNLAELAGNSNRGTAEKHLTVAQQQKKLQEQALIVGQQTMLAMMGLGMNFPP